MAHMTLGSAWDDYQSERQTFEQYIIAGMDTQSAALAAGLPFSIVQRDYAGILNTYTPVEDTTGWLDKLGQYATQFSSAIAQYQLSQLNIERAQRGLQPISSAQLGPTFTVGVGATPQTTWLIIGAVAVLAFVMLRKA